MRGILITGALSLVLLAGPPVLGACPALTFPKPDSCTEGVDRDLCATDFEVACTNWLTGLAASRGERVKQNSCPQKAQECAKEFVPINLNAPGARPKQVADAADLERVLSSATNSVLKDGKPIARGKRPTGDPQVSKNCNLLFLELGKALGKDGWTTKEFSSSEPVADDVANALDKCAKNGCGRWSKVSPEEAQRLANKGFVVVGAQHHGEGETDGHLAIVEPLPAGFDPKRVDAKAELPFVRDGNQHHWKDTNKDYESTRGSVPANRAFKRSSSETLDASFFLFIPHPEDAK